MVRNFDDITTLTTKHVKEDLVVSKTSSRQKRYEEYLAKYFLEWFDPDTYMDLKVEDRPDLISEESDIGIEVTQAVDQAKATIMNLTSKEYSDDEKDKKSETEEKNTMMKDNKYFRCNGIFTKSWLYEDGANSSIFDLLYQRIEDKLKKLNDGGYNVCGKYELFIETEMQIKKEWCFDLYEKIVKISNKYRISYSKIMILSRMKFVIFDIKNSNYKIENVEPLMFSSSTAKAIYNLD